MIRIHNHAPLIMGILNITPDSFSDGGSYADPVAAVKQALKMVNEGADIIDVGGESTRPGAQRIAAAAQLQRVLPVIGQLRETLPPAIAISIDTTLADVAAAAIEQGATIINDVSAGRDDARMFSLAATNNVTLILMHMQGTPGTMQDNPIYADVVEEVYTFLLERADLARRAGVSRENIVLDPGIGFGKTFEHNLAIIRHLHRFVDSGFPVLLGASRKRFLKTICANEHFTDLAGATSAITTLGVAAGVGIFRVHDVMQNRQAADVAWQIKQTK